MKNQTRIWTIEQKEPIGPLSSYALALWGMQGLLFPNDMLSDGGSHQRRAGYLEGMMPFIRNDGHLSRARLWAIAGGKGGVGKSVLTLLLGVTLARAGKRVVIVDADFDGANQRQLFGLQKASPNIWRLIDKKAPLSAAALATPVRNLRIITAPEFTHDATDATVVRRIAFVSALRHLDADYVLLDFGPRVDHRELGYFLASDLNIVASTSEPTSMENLSRFIKSILLQQLQLACDGLGGRGLSLGEVMVEGRPMVEQALELMRENNFPAEEMMRRVMGSLSLRVLFNQVQSDDYRKQMRLLNKHLTRETGLGVEIAGALPYDPVIRAALRANKLFALDPDSAVMRQMAEITHRLRLARREEPGHFALKGVAAHDVDPGLLFCGTWCQDWSICNFRSPGQVCPVKNLN